MITEPAVVSLVRVLQSTQVLKLTRGQYFPSTCSTLQLCLHNKHMIQLLFVSRMGFGRYTTNPNVNCFSGRNMSDSTMRLIAMVQSLHFN